MNLRASYSLFIQAEHILARNRPWNYIFVPYDSEALTHDINELSDPTPDLQLMKASLRCAYFLGESVDDDKRKASLGILHDIISTATTAGSDFKPVQTLAISYWTQLRLRRTDSIYIVPFLEPEYIDAIHILYRSFSNELEGITTLLANPEDVSLQRAEQFNTSYITNVIVPTEAEFDELHARNRNQRISSPLVRIFNEIRNEMRNYSASFIVSQTNSENLQGFVSAVAEAFRGNANRDFEMWNILDDLTEEYDAELRSLLWSVHQAMKTVYSYSSQLQFRLDQMNNDELTDGTPYASNTMKMVQLQPTIWDDFQSKVNTVLSQYSAHPYKQAISAACDAGRDFMKAMVDDMLLRVITEESQALRDILKAKQVRLEALIPQMRSGQSEDGNLAQVIYDTSEDFKIAADSLIMKYCRRYTYEFLLECPDDMRMARISIDNIQFQLSRIHGSHVNPVLSPVIPFSTSYN